MNFNPIQIGFSSLEGGDFNIAVEFVLMGEHLHNVTVNVKASEIQGLDFIQVIGLFRQRLHENAGTSPTPPAE